MLIIRNKICFPAYGKDITPLSYKRAWPAGHNEPPAPGPLKIKRLFFRQELPRGKYDSLWKNKTSALFENKKFYLESSHNHYLSRFFISEFLIKFNITHFCEMQNLI
ncbi:Uncharacterized protein dnm_076440 [Desulfonema magnum]|uniref:Uncharacterized protein n=1 Tax=Desulfonema magnum TaxID=45655 RepID=A0A975GS19_9BACT|nr:Uncharacterized protein dnm_076440 [Desulfonema magnum]